MESSKLNELIRAIRKYFLELPEDVYPAGLKEETSIFLSGSTGWGIHEGFDEKADWDLHLILEDKRYEDFACKYGENHVIDDKMNRPIVFGQIRSRSWLKRRLDKLQQGDCLYTWIYTNCVIIQDPLGIEQQVIENEKVFHGNIEELAQFHLVTFFVRRFDTASIAKRGIDIGARLANAEMAKTALQTISILHTKPYPYFKWIAKHVTMLGEDGEKCVGLVDKALKSPTLNEIVINAKTLRDFMEQMAIKKFGPKQWIKEWWKFNQNPPDINLVEPKTSLTKVVNN